MAGIETHLVVRPNSDMRRLRNLVDRAAVHMHDGTTRQLIGIVEQAAPEVVFHLATSYRREHLPEELQVMIRANVEFGAQLVEAMRLGGANRLVNTGSYFQWHEGDRALNFYAATKWAFQAILDYYADAHGLEVLTLVLFDVYGPGDQRAKLISAVVEALNTGSPLALPSEDPLLDFVYVDDAVSAFVQAADLLEESPEQVGGRHFAISSGKRRKLSETVSLFEELAGRSLERSWGTFSTPDRQILHPWEGESRPGWRPQVSLREGIARLLAAESGR